MSKLSCIAAIFLFLSTWVHAQNSGQISGKVTDSLGKDPLALSTVTVFRAKDTVIVTYRLSGNQGEFKIPGLPLGVPLRLLVTYSGYDGYRKEFTLTSSKSILDLGTIKMLPTSKQLDEVIVVAERPPVVVRKDTVEFNAASFKTLPNAYVEDLLKKLPGVMIDADGAITVNGRKVNRILVDGKNFFNENTQMSTKNLPREFIDKVQITDDKDEIAEKNDGDLSTVGKVINLTLKKNVKKKWFGRAYAGIGSQERYEAGINLNTLKDTLQLSATGNSNNTNRNGQRSGMNTSNNAGVNLNYAPSKNKSFSAQYNYSGSINSNAQINNTLRFLGDTSINTRTHGQNRSTYGTHRVSIGGNLRTDTVTNINFRIDYAYNNSDTYSPSDIFIHNNLLGPVSTAESLIFAEGWGHSVNQNFSFTRRSRKKRGRNFSFSENISINYNPSNTTTESHNNYFLPSVSQQLVSQLRSSVSPSSNINMAGSYSDDLSKKWVLRINSRFNYNKNSQDVLTYAKPVNGSKHDSLNTKLSSYLERENILISNMVGIGYRINKVTVSLNATFQQQWVNNYFDRTGTKTKQFYSTLLPSLTANWKQFNFTLSRSMNLPGISSLNPVPNNSNPYYVSYGNPFLQPAMSTSLNFSGNIYNQKRFLNLGTHANLNFTDNAITQIVTMDNNGIQTSRPVNVDGTMNGFIALNASKQFRNGKPFRYSINFGMSGSINRNILFFNGVQSDYRNLSITPNLGINFDWDDKFEFFPRYAATYSKARYSNNQFSNREVITHNVSGQITARPERKTIFTSSFNYRYNPQVSAGLPKSNMYWTASLSRLMLKDDRGELKLEIYDILNRNNSYNRYISGNSIMDSESNVLRRFFLLSFIYNIRPSGSSAGGRNAGTRNINMNF
jgi:hypothetical protein